jgi:hypothetical protein
LSIRQQFRGYVVGEWRTRQGMLCLCAADRTRREVFELAEFKVFNSRQAAARWRDYRPQSWGGDDCRHLAVIPLPVPQDD